MSDARRDATGQAPESTTESTMESTVESALSSALRARAGRAPGFAGMLRVASAQAAGAPGATRVVVPAWRQAVFAGGVLAVLGSLLVAYRGASLAEDAQLARDLEIARNLSPERQWQTPTDALIAARGFHTPVIVEMPGIDNPFRESVL